MGKLFSRTYLVETFCPMILRMSNYVKICDCLTYMLNDDIFNTQTKEALIMLKELLEMTDIIDTEVQRFIDNRNHNYEQVLYSTFDLYNDTGNEFIDENEIDVNLYVNRISGEGIVSYNLGEGDTVASGRLEFDLNDPLDEGITVDEWLNMIGTEDYDEIFEDNFQWLYEEACGIARDHIKAVHGYE